MSLPPSAFRHPQMLAGLLVIAMTSRVLAQDSVGGRRTADGADPRTADSVQLMRPISAFWRSLLIPGWGQAATKRWVTGATFTAWEGTCILMTFKAKGELKHIRAVGAAHVTTKEQEVQDWAVLWVFNHLFAGAEAFVAGHLQDFPEDLHVRAVPRGFVVSIPFPRQ